jgi:hypothetical protein
MAASLMKKANFNAEGAESKNFREDSLRSPRLCSEVKPYGVSTHEASWAIVVKWGHVEDAL